MSQKKYWQLYMEKNNMEKLKLVIDITHEVFKKLEYISNETNIDIKSLIEDFISDSADDLLNRFSIIEEENK